LSRRILVVVPNTLRDLEGHALMGYHLEKCLGHEVRYSTGTNLVRDLLSYAPDGVVMDHLSWDYRARQALLVKRIGAKLFLLPTSGLFRDLTEHELIAGRAFHVNGLVDCYMSWSRQAHDKLLSNGLLKDTQIRTTGSPRFDFYSAPYTSLIGDRAQFLEGLGIRNAAAPVVVWAPGNVAFAAVGSAALKRWKVGTNVDPDFFKEEMVDVLDQYNEHAPLVVELARRRPGWSVVVKVHPGDQLSRFLWMREKAANITVVQGVPIRELLAHANVLLQRCSTAANEAWLLGKPVLALGTSREVLRISAEYSAGNTTVRSLDELVAAADGFLEDSRIPEDQQRARTVFLEETYYRVDGRSAERCARAVHELVTGPGHTDEDHQRIEETARAVAPEFERGDIQRATNRFKAMFGLEPSRSLRIWRRWGSRDSGQERRDGSARIPEAAVAGLYAEFARVHGQGCRRRPSRSGEGAVPVASEPLPVRK
jgi:surface carbohydrate biosynthesis protein